MQQRLIDEKTIKNAVENAEFNNIQDAATALQLVTECPTIDPLHALGACYCRECVHYAKSTMKCFKPVDDEHTFHDYAAPIWKPTDFCSYGERKENEILD